jgi:hypothetical protein
MEPTFHYFQKLKEAYEITFLSVCLPAYVADTLRKDRQGGLGSTLNFN